MEPIKCFWIEPLGITRTTLRRYHSSSDETQKCSGKFSYHNAHGPVIGEFKEIRNEKGYIDTYENEPKLENTDPRWPKKCDHCDYEFTDADPFQNFHDSLYRRTDTGEILTLRDAPIGAMWDAWWYGRKGPDGRSLMVKCPGDGGSHDWHVDGRASNCTLKDDDVHYCWVRHGEVPDITVDKGGFTCAAGAGSILTPGWHGFLRNGHLVTC